MSEEKDRLHKMKIRSETKNSNDNEVFYFCLSSITIFLFLKNFQDFYTTSPSLSGNTLGPDEFNVSSEESSFESSNEDTSSEESTSSQELSKSDDNDDDDDGFDKERKNYYSSKYLKSEKDKTFDPSSEISEKLSQTSSLHSNNRTTFSSIPFSTESAIASLSRLLICFLYSFFNFYYNFFILYVFLIFIISYYMLFF